MPSHLARHRFLSLIAIVAVAAAPAMADTLAGSTVTGSLVSDNTNTVNITTPFTSPQVVGPGVEFNGAFSISGASTTNYTIAADFFDTGLQVNIASPTRSGAYGIDYITLSFSDPAFIGPLALSSYTCNTSVYSGCANPHFDVSGLDGDTYDPASSTVKLTFDTIAKGQTYNFAESSISATPEPSSIALLGTGLLGAATIVRRRFLR